MGVAPSSCRNNNDLVDSLLIRDFIRSVLVERVYRAVDRAEYFPRRIRAHAYSETAWKWENLHISSPCIYAVAMEALDLKPALSFLNLGSGSGLMSTMVGLILGSNGVNHGIEVQADIVEYANQKLEDFKRLSGAMDEFDFCEPRFVHGNCLSLACEFSMVYDRIYCGAACTDEDVSFIRRFLKIGGILVLPSNEELLQIRRLTATTWQSRRLLNVAFSALIRPSGGSLEHIKPIEVQPISLQVLCRTTIRNILRNNIQIQHPPVPSRKRTISRGRKSRRVEPVIIPQRLPDTSDNESQILILPRYSNEGRRVFGRDTDGCPVSFSMEVYNMGEQDIDRVNENRQAADPGQEQMETDDIVSDDPDEDSIPHQVSAVIEHHPRDEPNPESDENPEIDDLEVMNNDDIVGIDENEANNEHNNEDSFNNSDMKASCSAAGTSAAASPISSVQRGNIYSGVNDEIIEVFSSSEEEEIGRRLMNEPCRCHLVAPIRRVFGTAIHRRKFRRRVPPAPPSESSSDTDEEEPVNTTEVEFRMYQSPMTKHMREKIEKLPLPPPLKNFLLFL